MGSGLATGAGLASVSVVVRRRPRRERSGRCIVEFDSVYVEVDMEKESCITANRIDVQ